MTAKGGVRSGVLVAILAQCAALVACGADVRKGLSLDGDDGTGGAAPGGDGDDGTGGAAPGGDGDDGTGGVAPGGDGDGDECDNLIFVLPINVDVRGGWDEAQGQCRATVALEFNGEAHELLCSGVGSDCECRPMGMELPSDGVTLTVSDGETVLYEREDLQGAFDGCDRGPLFGAFEVDYIEGLQEAVARLSGAADDLVSTVPCETAADCEAVALGAKACGGPQSYAVVSNQSETYSEFVALAEELGRIEGLYNELGEVASDCAYEVAPEVTCATDLPSRAMCVAVTPL